jgi:nicotinamide-nucleotide amidase
VQAIGDSAPRCDVLLCSGGIGPTPDDLTRQALAAVMNQPLELNEAWLASIRAYFAARGRVMPQSNSIQAMIPRGARIIHNPSGTAAGMEAAIGACRVFVMPGVPAEMKRMFSDEVLPALCDKGGGAVILSKTLHTFGVGESAIAEMLGDLMNRNRNPSVGTTVADGIVSLRINARFDSSTQAADELMKTADACRQSVGDLIFGEDDQTLQESVAILLKESRTTVTTAESCTGGLLAKMLTDVAGSSDYFKVGFITYSNQAKYERLGVPNEVINVYGAVSEPVVQLMAKNARRLAKADYALAISGVAGPTGATAAKPVGTVCIALACPANPELRTQDSELLSRTFAFPGDRDWVRQRSARMALTMLRFHLLGKPLPL